MLNQDLTTEEDSKLKELSENNPFISVFWTTFTTVFLAELGDKTQIATLLLSAQSGKPLVVLIGASIALICTSLIAVLLGRWLSRSMPAETIRYMAGILMISIGLLLGIESTKGFF